MTLAYVSSTLSSASSTTPTALPVTYPASIAWRDVLVLLVGVKAYSITITTPAGWTKLGEVTNGTTAQGLDTGSVKMAAYYKVAAGNESGGSLTVAMPSANSAYACIYRITKAADRDVVAAFASGTDTTANTSWSVAYSSNPGITAGDLIIVGGVWSTDLARTVSASAIAATSATFSGIVAAGDQNPRVTTNNDLGGNTNHALCATGTASANPSWTATHTVGTNGAGSAVLVRLRETLYLPPPSLAMARYEGAW
jgi:hypothetical protein